MIEDDELYMSKPKFSIDLVTEIESAKKKSGNNAKKTVPVFLNFLNIEKQKKSVGDLGELIVMDYERERLLSCGKVDLSKKIEHVAKTKGDGLGYGIESYNEDGTPIFIEVKSTKQNCQDGFFLTEKEKAIADKLSCDNKIYKIYRVYSINIHTMEAKLTIMQYPLSSDIYDFVPKNWKVEFKNNE